MHSGWENDALGSVSVISCGLHLVPTLGIVKLKSLLVFWLILVPLCNLNLHFPITSEIEQLFKCFINFFFFFGFLEPHSWHMEVPRLGGEGGLIRATAAGLHQSHSNASS